MSNIGRWSNWLLRLEADSFIIVVNKDTNEYRNLYSKDFKNPEQINHMALLLDWHEYITYKGDR